VQKRQGVVHSFTCLFSFAVKKSGPPDLGISVGFSFLGGGFATSVGSQGGHFFLVVLCIRFLMGEAFSCYSGEDSGDEAELNLASSASTALSQTSHEVLEKRTRGTLCRCNRNRAETGVQPHLWPSSAMLTK
jgi:hypothetical protein